MPAAKPSTKIVKDPILGEVEVKYRTDSEIDALRIARVRACLAGVPAGSKIAQIYAAQIAGISGSRAQ